MKTTIRLPWIDICHGWVMIRGFLLISMISLQLCAGTSHAGPAKPLAGWLGKLVVAEDVEFPEAVVQNQVPQEVFGNKGRLGAILKRHGLEDRKPIVKYSFDNSVCYVFSVNEMYDIALFGLPTGPTDMDDFIGRASVFRKMPTDDFAKGLKQYLGRALLSDRKVRTSILKPKSIPGSPASPKPAPSSRPPPPGSPSPPPSGP